VKPRIARRRRQPYIIKVIGTPRIKGEYAGGETLAEARKEARTFLSEVRAAGTGDVAIVRYKPDGTRISFWEDVK
jgi:hypothetical protein